MATSNPILLRILTEDLGMSENEAQGHMARNTLHSKLSVTDDIVIARRASITARMSLVTDDIVIAISENWPELKSVDLHCRSITDIALIALATNCAGLRKINLSYCSSITNAGIIALANCVGLEVISLSNMSRNITDTSVIAIADNCGGLRSIDLSGCRNITDAAIIALADGCVGLVWISMALCDNITDAAIIALANCDYLQACNSVCTKVTATGRALIEEIKTRPKPPPLEKGWWLDMDDGTGPRCKGMMN
jgi:hypothetical protein